MIDQAKFHNYLKSKTPSMKPSSTEKKARKVIHMVEVELPFSASIAALHLINVATNFLKHAVNPFELFRGFGAP